MCLSVCPFCKISLTAKSIRLRISYNISSVSKHIVGVYPYPLYPTPIRVYLQKKVPYGSQKLGWFKTLFGKSSHVSKAWVFWIIVFITPCIYWTKKFKSLYFSFPTYIYFSSVQYIPYITIFTKKIFFFFRQILNTEW